MNGAQLAATLEANKVPVLAAAGAGVVGLALLHKKKAAASTPAAGGALATNQNSAGYSTGGQTAGMNGAAPYDSSASDVYGAIQPQLQSVGGQLTDLQNAVSALQNSAQTVPVPAPTPAPTPAPAPAPAPAAPAWSPPPPPPVPVAAPPSYAVDTWYTVKKGDTLSGIAARFPQRGITAASIGQANGIANLNRIGVGQRLHIFGN